MAPGQRLAAFHRNRGAALTVALYQTDEPERCGIAETDVHGTVRRFREKPAPGETASRWANAGVYAVEPTVLRFIPPDSFFDFGDQLIPLLLERGEPVRAYLSDSYFLDIGSPERYAQAERDLASGRVGVAQPSFDSVSSRVRFLGGIYEPGHIEEVYAGSYAYLHGHEVGGTNPALLHAMGCGCCVAALDVPFNREVGGETAVYWRKDPHDLARVLNDLLADPNRANWLRAAAKERVRTHFSWEDVADDYDRFFRQLAA